MKRKLISILASLIVLVSGILIFMQWHNAKLMVKMRKDEFDEAVLRSLNQASRDLERNETFRYLESITYSHEQELDSVVHAQSPRYSGVGITQGETLFVTRPTLFNPVRPLPLLNMHKRPTEETTRSFLESVRNAYIYQRGVLDEVIYTILYHASEQDLKDRVDTVMLDALLTEALRRNGITIPFHFKVETADGEEVFRCSDYEDTGSEYCYSQTLFRNDPMAKMGVMRVHFPTMNDHIWGVANTLMPMLLFTILLLVVVGYTIWQLARQKKVSEMKNDFINNMTHEFKTPLASISLAAQMLNDKSVAKTERMYDHLSTVISDETRRLRFQVEKVLQMSLFDHDNIRLKSERLDLHDMLQTVITTQQLRIRQNGGTLEAQMMADDPVVRGDEMHLTNVFFNLLDNAVKYARPNVQMQLVVHTENVGGNVQVTVQDNGIGIQKKDLGHIFERFYRVHTGNQHNVKGFGLGLAYVHTIIHLSRGKIKVESEYGQGTRFIITLPNE
ncbi:MAG: HAMP domain-containing histidine kinase [Bacteroidales bacterium]|nr:HAMP domain-containing histidine kinase [Candidatus Physcousia equi]